MCVELMRCDELLKPGGPWYVCWWLLFMLWCLWKISHVLYSSAGSSPPSPRGGRGASRLWWAKEPPCDLSCRRLRRPFPGLGRRCCEVLRTGGALSPVVCECRQGVVFEIPVFSAGNHSLLVSSSLSSCANCLSSPPCLVVVLGLFAASTSPGVLST